MVDLAFIHRNLHRITFTPLDVLDIGSDRIQVGTIIYGVDVLEHLNSVSIITAIDVSGSDVKIHLDRNMIDGDLEVVVDNGCTLTHGTVIFYLVTVHDQLPRYVGYEKQHDQTIHKPHDPWIPSKERLTAYFMGKRKLRS